MSNAGLKRRRAGRDFARKSMTAENLAGTDCCGERFA
jgi:hypothetical protein